MAPLIISLLSAVALAALGELRGAPDRVVAAVALLVAWGVAVVVLRAPRGGPARVFAAALAVRLVLVAMPPTLSDDLFRYLWEGRATLLGGNPFLHAPDWSGWPADAMRARVNHPEISTIYPPLAQHLFAALGALWYDPRVVKLAMGLCDAGTAAMIARALAARGRGSRGAWLYALHPLAAVESAGSGHLDALVVLLMVGAIAQTGRFRGLLFAGLGTLIKVFPAVLIPALLRWPGRRLPKGVALLTVGAVGLWSLWPFLDAGPALLAGLGAYAGRWSFNGAFFPVLHGGFSALGWEAAARPFAVALGAGVVGFAWVRRRDPAEVALWAGAAVVLLSPTVHPWYIPLVWAPALITGWRAWTALATLAPLSYLVLATLDPATGIWQEQAWTRAVIYLPFLVCLGMECLWRATRPGPWAPGEPRVAVS